MNAQSNHPISSSTSDTTDPLFLGPEAGQQAEVEAEGEQGGSELDANDFELHRHFSIARGALISVRSNGVTLCRQVDDDWMVLSRKKVDVPLAQWLVNKAVSLCTLARWQLKVDELPSMQDLMTWNEDGICETPNGHRVKTGGTGPDGVPSWLRALCLI